MLKATLALLTMVIALETTAHAPLIRSLADRHGDLDVVTSSLLASAQRVQREMYMNRGTATAPQMKRTAGLESQDSGAVLLSGEDATSQDVRERGVGFVFQHYALFRHMTVFENVAFGLRVKPRGQRRQGFDRASLVAGDRQAERQPSSSLVTISRR